MKKIVVAGKVVEGRRIASGLNSDPSLKMNATIRQQKPYFKSAGVSRVDSWYEGTINVSVAPLEFQILKPDYSVTAEWMSGIRETFWLVDVTVEHDGRRYPAYVYYPCPSDVKSHPNTIIEILAEKIDSLSYGDTVTITVTDDRFKVVPEQSV